MPAAIAVTPSAPSAKNFVRVDVTGADENTSTGYDAAKYPASPQVAYYLTFEKGGAILGRSYVFAPSSDGKHTFDNYTFPSAGSWTVRLNALSDDSSVATASVTVS